MGGHRTAIPSAPVFSGVVDPPALREEDEETFRVLSNSNDEERRE